MRLTERLDSAITSLGSAIVALDGCFNHEPAVRHIKGALAKMNEPEPVVPRPRRPPDWRAAQALIADAIRMLASAREFGGQGHATGCANCMEEAGSSLRSALDALTGWGR